ncbi:L-threonine 3-dehydrogenase [Yersinia enterocolitica]|uniref:Zn-dependent oxidoreductase n=1 Tax=Yersinia mollaretii TaxID=33060 RepID=UPI0005E4B590|nr:Zn-dependent oxidoreductase [Yersinia mollaretii]CNL35759.1 L-threonine 3-dehydrogenase [Yersinia enterocolitica]
MKSVVVEQPGKLVIQDREMPEPEKGEVRIKVKLAGICGSDSHIYHGKNPFAKYPRVIGHEFFGIIDSIGAGVDESRIGQRVAVDPVVSCGHCYPCSVDRPNVCSELQVIGVHLDGGFSQYACVPTQNAYLIPDSISDEFATTIEPFTIAANILSHLKPTTQDIALVYGAGPMGITVIQALKGVYGVKQIIIVDRIPERLDMAKACGADLAIDNSNLSLVDKLKKLGIRPTVIIDGACHPTILQEAITIASPAGRIGLMGFSSAPCTVTQQSITSKEISIFSSRLNSKRFPQVIEWMIEKKINPEKFITHRFDYTQVADALEVFEKDQKHCCKILLKF